jgi:DNA-binding CsgD family transcriptional regulator/GAF domain-containing protein
MPAAPTTVRSPAARDRRDHAPRTPTRSARRLDLHRLDRELEVLAGRGLDSHAFRHEAVARVRHVVPADGFCFSAADPDTLITTGHATGGVDAELTPVVYANEYACADVSKHADLARGRRPVRILEHETEGDPGRSARYRDLLRPMGMEHELRAATIEDGTTWGFLHLFRSRGGRPFSRDEAEAVAKVGRRLAAGVRAAALAPVVETLPSTEAPGVLLLDRADHVTLSAGSAEQWLRVAGDPDFADGPTPVLMALGAAARSLARDPRAGAPSARARTRDVTGAWWLLHAAVAGDDTGAVAVTVQPAPGPQMTTLVMRGLGFSDGERQVCELLLDGRSTKQIAEQLSISPWTVQDRLKTVFAKADVRSRRELVARLNPAGA